MIIQWRIYSHEGFMLYIVALEVMIEHCVIQSTLYWINPTRKGFALFALTKPAERKCLFHFIGI